MFVASYSSVISCWTDGCARATTFVIDSISPSLSSFCLLLPPSHFQVGDKRNRAQPPSQQGVMTSDPFGLYYSQYSLVWMREGTE